MVKLRLNASHASTAHKSPKYLAPFLFEDTVMTLIKGP